MVSWLVLTLGLLLGSWWAYTILGWGGYWAWDPVENSALMPWLAMTAFVHSIMVQKRRGMFRMWNMALIITAFTMAQMGMFINRGGGPCRRCIPSRKARWAGCSSHSWRGRCSYPSRSSCGDTTRCEARARLESFVSRESSFLGQNILFLTVAFVTLWGTIFPVFSEAADDTVITVGRPFFDRVNGRRFCW